MNNPSDNAFMRQLLLRATQNSRILEEKYPENDEEKTALILRGFKPSLLEGWYVLYADKGNYSQPKVFI